MKKKLQKILQIFSMMQVKIIDCLSISSRSLSTLLYIYIYILILLQFSPLKTDKRKIRTIQNCLRTSLVSPDIIRFHTSSRFSIHWCQVLLKYKFQSLMYMLLCSRNFLFLHLPYGFWKTQYVYKIFTVISPGRILFFVFPFN